MKLLKWFDEHGSKINWGASFLDGNAIADLNEALLEARKEQEADMFWDANNSETLGESIHDILISSDVVAGEFVQIQRAKSLEDITIRVTSYVEDKNEFTWKVIENE